MEYRRGKRRIPSEEEIEKAKVLIDYRHIEIGERSVFLKEKGMSLDLGGIAKEYALHKAAALAERMGECSMMIDAGGDICVVGNKPDGSAWRLGIQHPRQRSTLIATVALGSEDTVETSGDYRRFLLKDGLMQSHIFQIKKKITAYQRHAYLQKKWGNAPCQRRGVYRRRS